MNIDRGEEPDYYGSPSCDGYVVTEVDFQTDVFLIQCQTDLRNAGKKQRK